MNGSFNNQLNPCDPDFPYDPPMIDWMWDDVNGILTVTATSNGSLLLEVMQGDQVMQIYGENEVSFQMNSQAGWSHEARACALIGDRIVSYWMNSPYTVPDTGQNNEYEQKYPNEYGQGNGVNFSLGNNGNDANVDMSATGPSPQCDSEICIRMPRTPFVPFDSRRFDNINFYITKNDYFFKKELKHIFYDQTLRIQQPKSNLCWIAATASLLLSAQVITVDGLVHTEINNDLLKRNNYSQDSIDKLNAETIRNDTLSTLDHLFTEYYANRANIDTYKQDFENNRVLKIADYYDFFVNVNGLEMVTADYSPIGYFNLLCEYGPLLITYLCTDENDKNKKYGHEVVLCGITIEIDKVTYHIMDPWEGEIIHMSESDFDKQFFDYENEKFKDSKLKSVSQIIHLPKRITINYQEEFHFDDEEDMADEEFGLTL